MEQTSSLQLSNQPLYQQLSTIFRRRIEEGIWRAGVQVPTLDAIVEEFKVGRVTVRAALGELEKQGFITRQRGRGTFVREGVGQPTPRYAIGTTWQELVERGALTPIVLEHMESEVASSLPAWMRNTGTLAPSYHHLKREYSLSGKMVCFSDVYIESAAFASVRDAVRDLSVLTALGRAPGLQLVRGRQTLTVVQAGEEAASVLRLPVGSPIAEVIRDVYDDRACLVYFARVHFDCSQVILDTDLFGNAT
jgi:GntR family transcriptional regulator